MAGRYGKWIKIGGKSWDVLITKVSRKFSILDTDNAGRNIKDGTMRLDRVGTFLTYSLTFKKGQNMPFDEFDKLFDYLAVPRNIGIPVAFPYGNSTVTFNAYVASGEQELDHIDTKTGRVYWKEATFNFISMSAVKKA